MSDARASKPVLKIDWCTHEAARYAVENWHYSRVVPHQKTVKVGAWEDGKFIGCVLFGDGANNNMFKPYGLSHTEGCELTRVALTAHATSVTRIVSISLKFLRRHCPLIRLVASFADPERGHHGGIYQGGGWVYAGMTEESDEYIVNGARMHGRALRSTRSTHPRGGVKSANVLEWARAVLDRNARPVKGSSKHRYLFPLDAAMAAQIAPLAKPYPKRPAKSSSSGTPTGEGGALPTAGLQSVPCTQPPSLAKSR